MLTALFFLSLSFLWLHYLLEPNVPKSSLMYMLLIVYQDAFRMARGYLNPGEELPHDKRPPLN